jgi:TonB family protein
MNRSLQILLFLLLAGVQACTQGGHSAENVNSNPAESAPQAEATRESEAETRSGETKTSEQSEKPASERAERAAERKDKPGTAETRKPLPYDPNEPTPDPYEIQSLDTDAEPLNLDEVRKSIVYPAEVRKAGIGGTVRMKLLVDGSGRVADKLVRTSPDMRLVNATWEAAQRLRYSPATRGGKGVKTWVNFSHTF